MRRILLVLLVIVAFSAAFLLLRNPESIKNAQEVLTQEQKRAYQERTDLLLPDLTILAPKELLIAKSNPDKKVLRFSTTFVNVGKGPLEIIGHSDEKLEKTFATQYMKKTNGSGEYHDVGVFEYHPTHRHWHLENHVLYQLWGLTPEGGVDKLLSSTGKMSFCLWDEDPQDLKIEGAPQTRKYLFECNKNTQGMSVGWSDTYLARVDGQELDITSVADGTYLLTFQVNPDQKLIESTYDNNAGQLKIEIKGNRITVL